VVVHSTGRAFSSGLQTDRFRSADAAAVARAVDDGRRMIERLERMRPMTVAAANGHCIGGGVILLIACDLPYVADDVSGLLPETHLGIPLPWGGVPRLVRELGPARAAELILLDDRIGADRLAALGLVNGVVTASALLDTATATARRRCGLSHVVLQTTRARLREAREQMATTSPARAEETAVRPAMADAESAAVRQRTPARQGHRRQSP
jgi:enoyl-CoA hydratase/carnithine racemase